MADVGSAMLVVERRVRAANHRFESRGHELGKGADSGSLAVGANMMPVEATNDACRQVQDQISTFSG